MKNKKFFNLDQAIRYLGETVISFKNKPIYIYGIDSGKHSKNFELHYYDVGDEDRQAKYVLSDNSDIDMTPIPLGLMSVKNNKGSTGLIVRMPLRMYKIGLNRQNVKVSAVNGSTAPRFYSRYSDLMLSKELRDTVAGDYPSYTECLKDSEKDGNVLAFSRRFAVCGKDLYYKALGVPVGTAKKSKPELDENCFFLKEALEEDFKNA